MRDLVCVETGMEPVTRDDGDWLLVHVENEDGIIPEDSTEYPAPLGAGVFSVLGFYRSYYRTPDGVFVYPNRHSKNKE